MAIYKYFSFGQISGDFVKILYLNFVSHLRVFVQSASAPLMDAFKGWTFN